MINSLEGFKGRFKQAKEKSSELEHKTMEIIKSQEQKENTPVGHHQNISTYSLWESQKEK